MIKIRQTNEMSGNTPEREKFENEVARLELINTRLAVARDRIDATIAKNEALLKNIWKRASR